MRGPQLHLRTLIAVVVGAGILFAIIRADPWVLASILFGLFLILGLSLAAFVMLAGLLGVVAFVGAAVKVVTVSRSGLRPDRRGDSAPPGSD